MAAINLYTYADAIEHVLGYLGSDSQNDSLRDARRGILAAYREFASARRWSYYYYRGRIVTVGSFSAGTVQYTNSTRTVTYTAPAGLPITAATNAAPIQITTAAPHGLSSGSSVTIVGATGNTAANGTWTVTVIDAYNFSLNGSDGTSSGTYTGNGTWSESGGFPSWAQYGRIFFNNPALNEDISLPTGNGYISYQVASMTDSNNLVLSVNSNPGVDLPAGTTFTLYRDQYPLPADFLSLERLINFSNLFMSPIWCTPGDWLLRQRVAVPSSIPVWYTVIADPHYFGTLSAAFYPPPDSIYTFDFIYQRRPRPLVVDQYCKGTVTASQGSQTVTGSGTVWTSRHLGSSIRFSGSALEAPTGLIGSNPYLEERVITAVASNTSVTVDSPLANAYAGSKYVISDPVDIEEGAMLTAFQRCLEKQESITRLMKIQGNARSAYNEALIKAMEADNRHFERRQAGMQKEGLYDIWIHNTPAGPDIP